MVGKTLKMTVLVLAGLGVCGGIVYADKAELENKLEQEIAVKLDDVTIVEALAQIGQKAGLSIELSNEALWKLPDGAETRLSVELAGQLGESLQEMLNSFFMRYAVGGEALTVYPRPELKRILGRPTAQELKLLRNIYGSRMWISGAALNAQSLLNTLAGEPVSVVPHTELRRMEEEIREIAERTPRGTAPADPNAARGTPVTCALLLDAAQADNQPPRLWYLCGPEFPREVPEIRVVSQEEFWQAKLNQIVDVSFRNESGDSVVRTLATWADMDLRISGSDTTRGLGKAISLDVQNVELRRALEKAFAVLGVTWTCDLSKGTIAVEGVTQAAPGVEPRVAPGEAMPAGGYVGKISIPMEGGRYFIEFMLRDSDLTEELRRLREQTMNDIITKLSNDGQIRELLKQLSNTPAQEE